MSGKGLFIVFEGVEKCGKKTQSELLRDALTHITQKETLLIQFPDKSTPVGKIIDKYGKGGLDLDPKSVHLLYTANRWERQDDIVSALKSGINVIADRYSYSGIVNTAAKITPLSEAEWNWCRSTEMGLVIPDYIICLAPESFAEISARDGFGLNRFETLTFQKRLLGLYAKLSHEMESELCEDEGLVISDNGDYKPRLWHWIQATDQSVEDVHTCIMNILDPII